MTEANTNSFNLLNDKVQKWVYEQGWDELKQIQEESVNHIINGSDDIIITAATAGGKTEAAFLPIISQILTRPSKGFSVLCISPLKALINDQFSRLESISMYTGTKVYPWHGDISATIKSKALKQPENSILLITPESLEAMFITKASSLYGLFGDLQFVVIDELHSFIGRERGKQLQSLLSRISYYCNNRIRIVALSATIGDISIAKSYISNDPSSIIHIDGKGSRSLKIKINAYNQPHAETLIAEDIYAKFRGSKNLLFSNSRNDVELYTTRLVDLCNSNHVPNEFFPHHGNLSKEIRLDSEKRLKDNNVPATVIATSTLELGIDVGSVKQVGQINSPWSVSGLAQRLGRSGRKKGESAILRAYITTSELDKKSDPLDLIHPELVQTIAVVNLLLKKWYEPTSTSALHLSTFIQQVLSLIAERGGIKLDAMFDILCSKGAFRNVSQQIYIEVLKCLKGNELIFQDSEKFTMLAKQGERLVNDYEFYAAFTTSDEYRIVYNDKTIGYIPTTVVLRLKMPILLAGRKWEVKNIEEKTRIVQVIKTDQKSPIKFGGQMPEIADEIVKEMCNIYTSEDKYLFIDEKGAVLLQEARHWFHTNMLQETNFVSFDGNVIIFTWAGSKVNNTIALMLISELYEAKSLGICIFVKDTTISNLKKKLIEIAGKEHFPAEKLASFCQNKLVEKHDAYLNEELQCHNYASRYLNIEKSYDVITSIIKN